MTWLAEPMPLLLRGEDPQFQAYLQRVLEQERGLGALQPASAA